MNCRYVFLLLPLVILLAACESPDERDKKWTDKQRASQRTGDPAFQAFVGRLSEAVAKKDKAALRGMMSTQFLYRWDKGPAGETPFAYWEQHGLWSEISTVLSRGFMPNGKVMVAPAAAIEKGNYQGYAVGIATEGGALKFVYFVPPPSASAGPALTDPSIREQAQFDTMRGLDENLPPLPLDSPLTQGDGYADDEPRVQVNQ